MLSQRLIIILLFPIMAISKPVNPLKNAMLSVAQLIIETKTPNWNKANNQTIKDTSRKVGSGVILSKHNGIIVTNAHLVINAKNIVVTLNNGKHLIGNIIGIDNATDLAVIKVNSKHLPGAELELGDTPKVGDLVTAIGNPFGLSQTVTRGIISGINRHVGIEGVENFIQTDAPINPGNSGGALIDSTGRLIGVNTAILSKSGGNIGIGFAIPLDIVIPVVDQLVKYGKVSRGMIGVIAQDMTKDLAKAFKTTASQGALINHILENSPAEQAGIKETDIIVAIDDLPIISSSQLKSFIAIKRANTEIKLTIIRNNKTIHLTIKPTTKIKQVKSTTKNLLAGVTLENVTRILANGDYVHGSKVISTEPGSQAWLGGLIANDIIIKVNNTTPKSLQDIQKIAKKQTELLITVLRNNHKVFLILE